MSRNAYLLRRFGITEQQYETLLAEQQGRCFICGRKPEEFKNRLAVDHNHGTGEVRGLLCFRCNKFQIGRRTQEDIKTLKRIIEYLDREYTGWFVPPKKKRKKRRVRRRGR